MAQSDSSEELRDHELIYVTGSSKYKICGLIVVLGGKLHLVGEVLKVLLLLKCVIDGVVVPFFWEWIATLFGLQFLPLLLVDLVQEKVTSHMEHFNRLHVISL